MTKPSIPLILCSGSGDIERLEGSIDNRTHDIIDVEDVAEATISLRMGPSAVCMPAIIIRMMLTFSLRFMAKKDCPH